MRIGFVTHQFFPRFHTGVERLTLNLAAQLTRMGHECIVVTSADHSSGRTRPYAFEGVAVHPVDVPRADPAEPWRHERHVGQALRDVFESERFDVVDVMHPLRLPQAFDEAGRRGVPAVAHVADYYYLCARITMLRSDGTLCAGPGKDPVCHDACTGTGEERLPWARRALDGAAATVSPSRFLLDMHASQFDTSAWHHVPWGVDYALHPTRLPAPEHAGLTVGFLGTLLPHKGPHLLVEAMRLLREQDLRLELYGAAFEETSYERELRRAAADDPRIRFHGAYAHADLPEILRSLDLVAVPSRWHENLPTTGLNAVAAGVPLLAADVGGLRELVEDYDAGFTFRRDDAADLARVLAALSDDQALVAEARARLRHPPSLEEEAWRLEGIYRGALEGNGRR